LMFRRTVLIGLGTLAAAPALAQPGADPDAELMATATPTLAPPGPGVVRLIMTTGEGPLTLDLFADKAPITVANFLRYVDAGLYNRSAIYRGSQAPNAPQIGLVQGGARMSRKPIPPIAHESTLQTGLKHLNGTISMARKEPGSANSDFFICCGAAPYLDANPATPGENLGYAAFGQVVEGMDIVLRILDMPKSEDAENPVMRGQMLANPVPIITTVRA
jgi:peptidyl-prolyl cis-trans isomerase A (cyclophilin A)